jgi:hypothetical protein
MRRHSTAPGEPPPGGGNHHNGFPARSSGARIIAFRPRRRQSGLSAFFFSMPLAQQYERVRQLARAGLTPGQLSDLCRLPLAEVHTILGVMP